MGPLVEGAEDILVLGTDEGVKDESLDKAVRIFVGVWVGLLDETSLERLDGILLETLYGIFD